MGVLEVRVPLTVYSLAVVAAAASCSRGPATVKPPEIDPAAAAKAAIAQYDKNGDGALSAREVETSALSLERWDGDTNGSISQDEIARRLKRYVDHGTGMQGLSCTVRRAGHPLADAQVTLEPEEFLGGAVHPAYGTTGSDGHAQLSVAEEFRLRPDVIAVEVGLYKVKITHQQVAIREVSPPAFELSPFEDVIYPTFDVRQ
jgi:hypothetical protein